MKENTFKYATFSREEYADGGYAVYCPEEGFLIVETGGDPVNSNDEGLYELFAELSGEAIESDEDITRITSTWGTLSKEVWQDIQSSGICEWVSPLFGAEQADWSDEE